MICLSVLHLFVIPKLLVEFSGLMHATFLVRLSLLYLIILIIFGEEHII